MSCVEPEAPPSSRARVELASFVLLVVVGLLVPAAALAQSPSRMRPGMGPEQQSDFPIHLSAEPGAAFLLGQPQSDYYKPLGGSVNFKAGVDFDTAHHTRLGVELEAGWLGFRSVDDGGTPGTAFLYGAGVRFVPATQLAIGVPYLDSHIGAARTGALNRFVFDMSAGFAFKSGDEGGKLRWGPYVRYGQIVDQASDVALNGDAMMLVAGLSVGLAELGKSAPEPTVVADAGPDPNGDTDGDGVRNRDDKCPAEPEDVDGVRDDDGCPDRDNDGDGLADAQDKCPNEAETLNGYKDDDGCPDQDKTRAYVRADTKKIVIQERIFFAYDSAEIEQKSYAVLDDVASILKKYPQIEQVRIEGHTDDRGDAEYNQKLSLERAQSVMAYLIKRGISTDRLAAKGYGSSRPLVPAKTEAARDVNRRVEFVIVKGKVERGAQ